VINRPITTAGCSPAAVLHDFVAVLACRRYWRSHV